MNSHITLGEREKRAKGGEEQILVHSAEDSPGASKMSAQISSSSRQMGSCWCPVKPPTPPPALTKHCPPLPAPLLPWGSSSHLRATLSSLLRNCWRHIASLMLSLKRAQGRSEGARGFKGPGIEPGQPWRSAPTLIRRSLVIRPRSATSLDLVFSALLRLLQDFFRPKPSENHPLRTCTGGIFQPLGIFQITLNESCGEKKKLHERAENLQWQSSSSAALQQEMAFSLPQGRARDTPDTSVKGQKCF